MEYRRTSPETRALRATDFNAYKRAHYAENVERLREAQREKARARKILCVERAGGRCVDCGWSGPPAGFDFDHRDPATKRANPGTLMAGSKLETLFAEIDKCDLVCAACHRVRTHGSGRAAKQTALLASPRSARVTG